MDVAPRRNLGWRSVLACDDLPGSLVWRPIEPLQRPVHGLAMARVVRRNRLWRRSRSITSPRNTVRSSRSTTSTSRSSDGEFMVLVGPSGCGKTTSLRMIAGLEEITAGTLRIGDRVVNDVAPKDRDIAMVFQSYALYPHMTVRDNLAFGLKLRKVPKAGDRAAGQGGGRDPRPRAVSRPQAEGAVGRPAPARRARPGDRPRAGRVPHGRAALQPRRQAARPDPRRDRAAPPAPRDDDRLRHPRPGRGDDDGQPDRGHERGPAPAGRHARRSCTTTRSTGSSPASSAARR